MKSIGGYFELELPQRRDFPHSNAILVNTATNAFEYILRTLEHRPEKIWLPYYTCEVMLNPLLLHNIPFDFYHINNSFEVASWPSMNKNDYIVVNNYFGLKDHYIDILTNDQSKCKHLIIDNSQAWFAKEHEGINAFYSPRKYFGIPDGGIAYSNTSHKLDLEKGYSFDFSSHLLKRLDIGASGGYQDFHNNEEALAQKPLFRMSDLSKAIISSIDHKQVREIRRSNFEFIASFLNSYNLLQLPSIDTYECPMVYPFLTNDLELRHKLIGNSIFVASYWPNVTEWCEPNSLEYKFTRQLIPLPIDQRYTFDDMKRIINCILN